MPGQKIRFKHATIDWNKVLLKKKKKTLLNTWTLKAQNWETHGHDGFNCLKILLPKPEHLMILYMPKKNTKLVFQEVRYSCLVLSDWDSMAVACQTLPSTELSRQEYWSKLRFPTLGDLPNPGTEPMSSLSSALQADLGNGKYWNYYSGLPKWPTGRH